MDTSDFRNEMLELDGIIRKDVTRFLYDSYPLTDALYQGFNDELDASIREVKKRLVNGALRYNDIEAQRRYVLYHQQKLSDLAAQLAIHEPISEVQNPQKTVERSPLLLSLNRALQDLFDFINTFFPSALPGEQWLSTAYYTLVSHEIADGLETLQEKLRNLKVSQDLATIALTPLFKFVHRPTDNDFTYHRQTFIKKLKYELTLLHDLRRQQTTDDDIHELLFKLNFNSLAYLAHVGHVIRQRISGLPTVAKKIDKLRQMERDVSQIVQLPDVIFDLHNRQLKEYTLGWLQQEIYFWERVHEQPEVSVLSSEDVGPPENPHLVYNGLPTHKRRRLKTKFNLSVKVSAFFLTVLRETEVIEETDMKALTRDLSAIFRSKEREFISARSFYKKLSNVDTSTATGLRNLLLKLVKHIETTHGVRP